MSYRQGYRPQSNSQQRRTTANAVQQRGNGSRPAQQRPQATRAAANRTPPSKKRKQHKKRRHPIRIFLVLVLFAFVATAGVMAYSVYDEINTVERDGTFFKGVYIDNYAVHGYTPDEVYNFLLQKATDSLANWSITLQYEDRTWQITPDTLGLTYSLQQAVSDEIYNAFLVGRGQSFIDQVKTVLALRSEPYYGYTTSGEKNMGQIDQIVADIQSAVNRPPTDATIEYRPERKTYPFVTTPEQYGLEVDAEALKAQITNMINNTQGGVINIEPKQTAPSITAASLEGELVLIGKGETVISTRSTAGRTRNIEIGCERFNGKIVRAGQQVSFNEVTGRRSQETGYQEADEIVSGEMRPGWGGGICQVSSTLYNAVVHANLQVVKRTNHGIPVGYMELGRDATVSNDRHDFVFKNNTGSDIYITARVETSGKEKKCIFQIFGRPDPNGYTYEFASDPAIEIPFEEKREPDKQAEHVYLGDNDKIVKKGQVGYTVTTYKVTRDQNGNEISKEKISTDTYQPQDQIVYYGVVERF